MNNVGVIPIFSISLAKLIKNIHIFVTILLKLATSTNKKIRIN